MRCVTWPPPRKSARQGRNFDRPQGVNSPQPGNVGLARSNYGAIERGEFNVTGDTIVKIATVFASRRPSCSQMQGL
jgi:hypothetical protein